MADNKTPGYIADLLRPLPGPSTGDRRAWSIPLNATWIPFFVATNTEGKTAISHEALGAPIRLAKDSDGSVKFSKAGRPILRVVKELSDQVRVVRENFTAGLVAYVGQVQRAKPKEYRAVVQTAQKAGEPIRQSDADALTTHYAALELAAQAEEPPKRVRAKAAPTTPGTEASQPRDNHKAEAPELAGVPA